jgi:hypothetical protein
MEIEKSRAGSVTAEIGSVRAEHENEPTELVEHERFIQEREKIRKGSGRVVGADGDRTSFEKH